MAQVSHHNIVQYYGRIDITENLIFVTRFIMELCTCDLSSLSHNRRLFPHEVGAILWQVLKALCYLHRKDIVHRQVKNGEKTVIFLLIHHFCIFHTESRDIKPSNILIQIDSDDYDMGTISVRDITIKLTDFGLSRPVQRSGSSRAMSTVGSRWYMAPEIRHNFTQGISLSTYNKSCDIFSAGIVTHEMAIGRILQSKVYTK